MKVQFISTKFFVNEEKRTVTCEMVARLNSGVTGQDNIRLTYEGMNRFSDPFKVTTTARCHKDDEFSELLGKRIAESKAKRRVYSEGRKLSEALEKAINVYLGEVVKLKNNMISFKNKEIDHTKKLLGEVKNK